MQATHLMEVRGQGERSAAGKEESRGRGGGMAGRGVKGDEGFGEV